MNPESNLNGNPHVEFRKNFPDMPTTVGSAMPPPFPSGLIESENSMKLAPAVVPS
jgi:hypothetical protein